MHNTVATYRFNNPDGGDLTKETAFKNLQSNWSLYQKKYVSRTEFMKQPPRIHAVLKDRETVNLPTSCALLGILSDLNVGGKTDKACSSFSCSLRPERETGSLPFQFSELYSKRCTTYNTTNLAKITEDQLINFQLLVRMEIQFLASWDVDWQPSSKYGEGGANSTDTQHGDSAGDGSQDGKSETVGVTRRYHFCHQLNQIRRRLLQVLLPVPKIVFSAMHCLYRN